MKKFIVISLLFIVGQVHAVTDVKLAEEARALLWKLPDAGRGEAKVCRNVAAKFKKVGNTTKMVTPAKTICREIKFDYVVLAIKQPLKEFKFVHARMDTCVSLDPDFVLWCARDYRGETNGLNTEFAVTKPFGYKVYAIRRLGNTPAGRQEMVYSPFTSELDTPLVAEDGKKYLRQVIKAARDELRVLGVRSLAFPGKLVADFVREDVVHNLALIEHIDVTRFEKEPIAKLVSQVYTTLALNREDAYNLAPSIASANGLFQVIPRTYHSMVVEYPTAKLIFNYRAGTHHHVNAAKTAMVLLDHDLSLLQKKEREIIYEDVKLYMRYSATAYNGGPSCPTNKKRESLCAIQMYRKFGEFVKNNPNEENRTYVRKMEAVASLRK